MSFFPSPFGVKALGTAKGLVFPVLLTGAGVITKLLPINVIV